MEILDNSEHLNQLENQKRSHCHLRFAFCESTSSMHPMGSTLRHSREEDNDVGFLLRCKQELSAEVMRWKEKNHSLQKANESNENKLDELRKKVEKLTEKNMKLESRLSTADKENEQLRLHSLAMDNENSILFRKLSQGLNKYHSFPWADMGPSSPLFTPYTSEEIHKKSEVSPSQDWKEVSNKLFEQMKQEMKELQEMSSRLSIDDSKCDEAQCSRSEVVKIEDRVFNLSSKTKVLRQYLLYQRENLEVLIQSVVEGQSSVTTQACSSNSDVADDKKMISSVKYQSSCKLLYDSNQAPKTNLRNVPTKLSDENFRDYFTRQLQGKRSVEDMTAMMQLYMESKKRSLDELKISKLSVKSSPSNAVISQSCTSASQSEGYIGPLVQSSKDAGISPRDAAVSPKDAAVSPIAEEDHTCPICEAVFPKIIPYKDFEAHVVEHLEIESASLLDQYVIL